MAHTVYIDRGDHFHVIGDYSGSPRHRSLSEEAWRKEFETDSSYDGMKKSYPNAIAGITPQGVGYWTKDWSKKAEGVGCCK